MARHESFVPVQRNDDCVTVEFHCGVSKFIRCTNSVLITNNTWVIFLISIYFNLIFESFFSVFILISAHTHTRQRVIELQNSIYNKLETLSHKNAGESRNMNEKKAHKDWCETQHKYFVEHHTNDCCIQHLLQAQPSARTHTLTPPQKKCCAKKREDRCFASICSRFSRRRLTRMHRNIRGTPLIRTNIAHIVRRSADAYTSRVCVCMRVWACECAVNSQTEKLHFDSTAMTVNNTDLHLSEANPLSSGVRCTVSAPHGTRTIHSLEPHTSLTVCTVTLIRKHPILG